MSGRVKHNARHARMNGQDLVVTAPAAHRELEASSPLASDLPDTKNIERRQKMSDLKSSRANIAECKTMKSRSPAPPRTGAWRRGPRGSVKLQTEGNGRRRSGLIAHQWGVPVGYLPLVRIPSIP